MIDMRRPFFRMQPDSKKYATQWAYDVWRNQFCFGSSLRGLVKFLPTLYIPGLDYVVFRHERLSWEWGIVLVEAILFFAGVDGWK